MTTAKNEITGDLIQTKRNSSEYSRNLEGIDWSVKLEDVKSTSDKPLEPPTEEPSKS